MNELKHLYVQGLENHNELLEVNNQLIELGNYTLKHYTGNEDFQPMEALGDGMKSLGSGLLSVGGWVGGKTLTALSSVLGGAGNLLTKAFADNDVLIKKVVQQFTSDEDKEYKFSAAQAKLLSATGEVSTIGKDMETLIETLEILDQHSKDLLESLDKKMGILRELRNAKKTDDLYTVIDKYEKEGYPFLKFPRHLRDDTHRSEVLPGGKVMEFHEPPQVKYLMNGDSIEGTSGSVTMSKSDVSHVMSQLDKVNSMHKRFKASYETYLSFLKAWADMVKSVEGSLDKVDGLSKSAQNDAERLLGGEPAALAFYSGFTPRVISYTDRYIHGVLGVFV